MSAKNVDLSGCQYEDPMIPYTGTRDPTRYVTWESAPAETKKHMLEYVDKWLGPQLLNVHNTPVLFVPHFMTYIKKNGFFNSSPSVAVVLCHAINAYLKDKKDFSYPYALTYGDGHWKIHIIYNMKNEVS